jgi:FkbM family methyltransferase
VFKKAKTAFHKGYQFADKVKLLFLAAYTSRPGFRLIINPVIRLLAKGNLIKVSVNSGFGRVVVLLRCPDIESDYLSMTEILLDNCYQFPFDRKFDIIVDGGGNTGLFTVLCNRDYSETNILLFEPLEKNIEISKIHFKLNNAVAEIKKGIISLNEGEVEFYVRNANNSSLDSGTPYNSTVNVTSYNLAKELSKHKFSEALIKLDIEGAEVDIIPDLLKNLPQKNLFIIGELHNWAVHLKNLESTVGKYGYFLKTYNIDSICLLFQIQRV